MPKVDGKGVDSPTAITPQQSVEGEAPKVGTSAGSKAELVGPNPGGKK